MVKEHLLDLVPDWLNWEELSAWIEKGKKIVPKLTDTIQSLEWSEIEEAKTPLFGLYSSKNWRKFVGAIFLADLVSYSSRVDQVNFERLLFVMHLFPQGFRVWWAQLDDATWWPVGYSGWYPMSEAMFEIFEKKPHLLEDRTVVPVSLQDKPFLYLFNYSVMPSLKKSMLSRKLMQKFSQDILSQNAQGLACITVSEEGKRVTARYGMVCSGTLKIDDSLESICTVRD